ncbi:MAG: hypothetical protein JWN12_770 [Candidatus Saccharibacteria bacterium]|nr:hypothetical protein [Candidatus Saccharibacteria bacterium]
MSKKIYANGTYNAIGTYAKGKNSIDVTLNLNNDAISSVVVIPMATIKMSLGLQKKFAIAISDEVVGRPIDEVYLDKLAGSSLTTQGFNDAIKKIKSQALNS